MLILLFAPCSFTVPVKSVLGERCCGFPQGLPLPDPSSLGLEGGGLHSAAQVCSPGHGGGWEEEKEVGRGTPSSGKCPLL